MTFWGFGEILRDGRILMLKDVAHDILGVRRNSPRCQNPMLKDVAHDILGVRRNSPRCQNPMLKDVAHDILGVRRNSPRWQNLMLKTLRMTFWGFGEILRDARIPC